MRGRSDGLQKKRLITSVCVVVIFLVFLYAYYESLFSSQGHRALEYGGKSLRRLGSSYLGGDDDSDGKHDNSSSKFGNDEDDVTPKSFPVSCLIHRLPYSLFCSETYSLFASS